MLPGALKSQLIFLGPIQMSSVTGSSNFFLTVKSVLCNSTAAKAELAIRSGDGARINDALIAVKNKQTNLPSLPLARQRASDATTSLESHTSRINSLTSSTRSFPNLDMGEVDSLRRKSPDLQYTAYIANKKVKSLEAREQKYEILKTRLENSQRTKL